MAVPLFRFTAHGMRHIPKRGRIILASNHASNLDPLFVGVAAPRRINYLAKKELFSNRLFGFILRKICSALPVDRDQMDRTTLREILRLLEHEEMMLVFPEGTRTHDGRLGEAKLGVGLIALHAKATVILDLGCGTGLAGVEFRPLAQHLTGVDLSPRMVQKAREKKVYDELMAGDIIALLKEASRTYALFICADVMPYIGDLTELFGAVRARAAPDAWFLFSTELTQQDDYRLQPTGRYAHSQTYLRKLAATSGFTVVECHTEPLRKQQEGWITGSLVVLRL